MTAGAVPSGRLHRVRIDSFTLAGLLEAHRAASGKEPCGILVGTSSATGIDVVACWPVVNAHVDPSRAFQLPPAEVVAAQERARERGFDVVGTWHGHLEGEARLSGADVAGLLAAAKAPGSGGVSAVRPHVFLVSAGRAGARVIVRAFVRGAAGDAAEVPLRVLPSD